MPSARITDGRLIRAATGSAARPKGRTQPLRGRLQTVGVSVTTDRRSQVLARPTRCPLASWPHQADGLASASANINALELALPTHPAVQISIELQSTLAGIRWAHTVCRAHSSATRDLQCGARTGAGLQEELQVSPAHLSFPQLHAEHSQLGVASLRPACVPCISHLCHRMAWRRGSCKWCRMGRNC